MASIAATSKAFKLSPLVDQRRRRTVLEKRKHPDAPIQFDSRLHAGNRIELDWRNFVATKSVVVHQGHALLVRMNAVDHVVNGLPAVARRTIERPGDTAPRTERFPRQLQRRPLVLDVGRLGDSLGRAIGFDERIDLGRITAAGEVRGAPIAEAPELLDAGPARGVLYGSKNAVVDQY